MESRGILLFYYFTRFRSRPSFRLLSFLFFFPFPFFLASFLPHLPPTHPQLTPLTSYITPSNVSILVQPSSPLLDTECSRNQVIVSTCLLLHHLPSFSHKDELLALIEYATATNNGVFILFTGLVSAISQKNSISAIQD